MLPLLAELPHRCRRRRPSWQLIVGSPLLEADCPRIAEPLDALVDISLVGTPGPTTSRTRRHGRILRINLAAVPSNGVGGTARIPGTYPHVAGEARTGEVAGARTPPPVHRGPSGLRGRVSDAVMAEEPAFVPRPGQVDYTHIRYAPVVNAVVVCGGKVLLLQRSSSMRSYPNHWCGISGYLDDQRSVEDKARQEMLEEVGITADRILSMRRGTVLLQEAPDQGKSWLVVPLLVRVGDSHYRLDWESQAAGWFTMAEAMAMHLLPGFDAVIAQYRAVVDRA
jgi:8-oxo-dGTP diphosphatase